MGKTILIFIGLKISEISGFLLAWWLLCHAGVYLDDLLIYRSVDIPFWIGGFIAISILGIIFVICFVIWMFIKINWAKAKKLSRRY